MASRDGCISLLQEAITFLEGGCIEGDVHVDAKRWQHAAATPCGSLRPLKEGTRPESMGLQPPLSVSITRHVDANLDMSKDVELGATGLPADNEYAQAIRDLQHMFKGVFINTTAEHGVKRESQKRERSADEPGSYASGSTADECSEDSSRKRFKLDERSLPDMDDASTTASPTVDSPQTPSAYDSTLPAVAQSQVAATSLGVFSLHTLIADLRKRLPPRPSSDDRRSYEYSSQDVTLPAKVWSRYRFFNQRAEHDESYVRGRVPRVVLPEPRPNPSMEDDLNTDLDLLPMQGPSQRLTESFWVACFGHELTAAVQAVKCLKPEYRATWALLLLMWAEDDDLLERIFGNFNTLTLAIREICRLKVETVYHL